MALQRAEGNLISGPSSLGQHVRTCPWAKDFKLDCPVQSEPPVKSARDFLDRSVERNPNSECLGWRPSENAPYSWMKYSEFGQAVKVCRAAISSLGLEKGDRIGIYAQNCPQWTIIQYAALSGGLVPVPIYDTLGPDTVEYVCNHAEIKVVFVSCQNFENLVQVKTENKIPSVNKVVILGSHEIKQQNDIDELVNRNDHPDPLLISIMDFYNQGKDCIDNYPEPELCLDDVFVIMYTSGTTGNPKGVVLTHGNFIASVASATVFFNKFGATFSKGDSVLSYLPLAHIFEQQVQAIHIAGGAAIGFYSGNVKLLLSDLESLKPTTFIGVPRVYARFQQSIEKQLESASFLKSALFNFGYNRQLRALQQPGKVLRSSLWDKLIFNKIRDKLLPRAQIALTGSAPMSSQTNDFLSICLNVPVTQGYGLTETVGGMNCSIPGQSVSGHVGGPLPGAYVKLVDVPEMGYLTTNNPPQGEILVKGEFVFKEYYKNEQATNEAFDEDGYFKTGDIGQWLDCGALQIIDRAKNIFKLSQGEYVSPDPLEQEFSKCKLVGQIFVYGNSLQNNLVAVVVPDIPETTDWGHKNGGISKLEDIVKLDEFKKDVLSQLAEMRDRSKMKKYETIIDVIFEISNLNDLGQGFHIENDLMTPSFKLRRPQLKKKYGLALDALYEKE